MSVDVSVVIVSYHCRDEVLACLASIAEGAASTAVEVIVLDNDSGDGTVEAITERFPDVRVLPEPVNLGFARGVNRAAEHAQGEFLLLLNPDTVVHEGAIDNLVAFARAHPEHGLYGGRTLDPDGTPHPASCWGAPTLWSLTCFATMLSTVFKRSPVFDPESLGHWQRDTVREVDIITGCLLLVRSALWRELGGFDARYFMYGEDVDLALRARSLGYRPAITPDAVITHEIGVSSESRPEKFRLVLQGKVTVIDQHWSPARRRLGRALLTAGVGTRALAAAVTRRGATQGSGAGAATWRQLWRERSTWLAGFPAHQDR
ncbi:MAG: glycosyltransferase family 2 protein [Gaiellales bacterium]